MSERSTWTNPPLHPSRPWVINLFVSAALSVPGCLSVRTICSSRAIVFPPCWAIRLHVDIFVWWVPSERSVNLRYRMDRGGAEAQACSSMWKCKGSRGGCWLSTPLVCLTGLENGGGGRGWRVTHYKGVSKLKPRLLSFLPLFFLSDAPQSCWRSFRISEHLSWRGSWDARLACPPRHPHPPFSASIQPHYTKTFHFALPNCRSPLVWLQRTLIFILGRAVALVLAGVRPLLPLLSCHITRTRWKVSCCLPALKLLAVEFQALFPFRLFLCLNRRSWTFPPCKSVHYVDEREKKRWGWRTLEKVCVVYSTHYPICLSSLYFLRQDPHS